MRTIRLLPFLLLCALSACAVAQLKPLDPSVYDGWRNVRNIALSNNGRWVLYTIAPQEGDAVVEVKATDGSKTYTLDRGTNVQFSEDEKFVVATIVPKAEDTKKARRAKAKPEDMPKNSLAILNLETGARTDIDKVTSYSVAPHDKGWILYRPEPPKPTPAPPAKPGEAAKPAEAPKPVEGQKPEDKKPGPKPDHRPGSPWTLRQLSTGKEETLENVVSTRWSKFGDVLAYTVSTKDGEGDGVVGYGLGKGSKKQIFTGLGKYPKLALAEDASALAWVTDKDDYQAKKPALSVYLYSPSSGRSTVIAKDGSAGLPENWGVSETGSFQFSTKGTRLIFATAPKAEEEKKDDTPDEEKVSVDIWNWQDPQMMPQQILQAAAERSRTFDAIYDLQASSLAQIETPSMKNVSVSDHGDGATALGRSNDAYERASSWQETRGDFYSVDLRTGKATPLLTNFPGNLSLSPSGKLALGYNEESRELFTIDMRSGKKATIGKDIPNPIWDEETDTPSMPGTYGSAGFLPGEDRVLMYDRYDIWSVATDGSTRSVNLTGGLGRRWTTQLRVRDLDTEADYVDLKKPVLLGAFNETNKQAGFYRLQNGVTEKLMMVDKAFAPGPQTTPIPTLIKARNADVFAFQQMDVDEPANAWIADANLANPRKLSDANPQQKNYNWLTAELVSWLSNDGQQLQGILYKPANFDPSKKYPMIAYFYEKSSDNLHQYYSPAPSASTINISMYCSNGYLVFVPDIPYKVGYPGESAVSAIIPGVQAMVARGYVDAKHLGIQGQSWGGYQVGYLVTESNMFAAACAGAPVSNMVSAYGGIRWGSGVTREGQYEHGQSRIGGSLWENPMRFIENSPIFFADKVKTPLLIMSNDKDGAVPWYQGIEFFSALRRIDKPAWLVVYNEEDHNLVQRKNRKDWSIRMQQFFDHYLKGEPMPVWMAKGVPATLKGKTYGFDLVPGTGTSGSAGNGNRN